MNSQPHQPLQQQQQQHTPAHYTLQHTLTFTPPQPPLTSSNSSPYYSTHAQSAIKSNVSNAAAQFHATVSFPNHVTPAFPSTHTAFAQPFVTSQPGSYPMFHSALPPALPVTFQHTQSPFTLHTVAPSSSFPPPPPTPARSGTDSAAFHAALARLSAVDAAPYSQPTPTHSSPTTYSLQPYPLSTATTHPLGSSQSHSSLPVRAVRASVWHCPHGCGQSYKKSSGRSIRRHFVACFRLYNPSAAATMSDAQLSTLIAEQQDTGQLQTGLRRWRMRSARRRVEELRDEERWECVWGCGKRYRSTSTRSIQRHIVECDDRSGGRGAKQHSRKAGRETDEDDEDDDDEGEAETEKDRAHIHHSYQSTASHSPRSSSTTPSQSVPPPTAPSLPTFSSDASLVTPALTSTAASASSDVLSYPSTLSTTDLPTLQLPSSTTANALLNNHHVPSFQSSQHIQSPPPSASSATPQSPAVPITATDTTHVPNSAFVVTNGEIRVAPSNACVT